MKRQGKSQVRRFDREQMLNVKMRAPHVRAVRLRFLATFLTLILTGVICFFVFWRGGEWVLNELVFQNAAFNVEQVAVETDGVIPVEQLKLWAGVTAKDNLLAIDLMRIRRDLELQPWIRGAVVERVFPGTLRIRVLEREPVARISILHSRAGASMPSVLLVDASGFAMFPYRSGRPAAEELESIEALPQLMGLLDNAVRPGRRVESARTPDAIRFIAAFHRSPMAGVAHVKSIDLSSPGMLLIRTWQENEITFGADDFDGQLRRWRAVHDYAAQNGRRIASLNLSVANNVPARWHEASLTHPGSTPVPAPKNPRQRKKNV